MKLFNKSNSLRFLVALCMFSTCTVVPVKKGWKKITRKPEQELLDVWCKFNDLLPERLDHLASVLKKYNTENDSRKIKNRVRVQHLIHVLFQAGAELGKNHEHGLAYNRRLANALDICIKECRKHEHYLENPLLCPCTLKEKNILESIGTENDGLQIFYPEWPFLYVAFSNGVGKHICNVPTPDNANQKIKSLCAMLNNFTKHNGTKCCKKGILSRYLIHAIKDIQEVLQLFPKEKEVVVSFKMLAQKIEEHLNSLNTDVFENHIKILKTNCMKTKGDRPPGLLDKVTPYWFHCTQCEKQVKDLTTLYCYFWKGKNELEKILNATSM